jgi:hypothetical protein
LKRVIFLEKTLSKYTPLLEQGERINSLQAVSPENKPALGAHVYLAGLAVSDSPIVTDTVTSVPISAQAPPALLRLTAKQIGDTVRHNSVSLQFLAHLTLVQVAAIGPAYAEYRQLIIDNNLTGKYVAGETHTALASTLGDIGITKKLHVSSIIEVLMQLKFDDENALKAACSQPSC